MTAVSEQIGPWLAAFTEQAPAEPWVQALRDAAFQRFSEIGFPTTHDEEWRFTNVAPIARNAWPVLAHRPGVPESARAHLARYAPLSNPFVALNRSS